MKTTGMPAAERTLRGTQPGGTPPGGRPAEAHLLRQAAAGALLAALSYLLQPVIVFTFYPPTESATPADSYSDVADLAARIWEGPVEAAVFCGVGFGLLLLTLAVARLLRGRADSQTGVAAAQSHSPLSLELLRAMGVFSSAGWFLTAGLSLAMYSPISLGLAETGADATVQKAAIQLTGVVITGALGFAALTLIGWLIGFAVLGVRSEQIGWPLAVVSALLALACVLSAAIVSTPYAVLGLIPYLLILASAFWLKARRAAAAVSVSPPALTSAGSPTSASTI